MVSEWGQSCRAEPLTSGIGLTLLGSVRMEQDAQLVAGVRELVSVETNSHIRFRNIVSRINETCFPFTRQPSPTSPDVEEDGETKG